MQRFPGKTLEELEGLDWPRLMRAIDAGETLRIEDVRENKIRHNAKVTPEDWRAVIRHDDLVSEASEPEAEAEEDAI